MVAHLFSRCLIFLQGMTEWYSMKQGRHTFPNGLTIVYIYPDNQHPNISSMIQMHFGFDGKYGQRKEATFQDAQQALDNIREDIDKLKVWVQENGLPQYFSGQTETQLLLRVLREMGVKPERSTEGGAYSFRVSTEGYTLDKFFTQMRLGIENVQNHARNLEGRRIRKQSKA